METRNVKDVSCFFLVEATGDSEVNYDDTDPNMHVNDLDNDDAESCSCEVSYYHSCESDLDGCEEDEEPSYANKVVVEEEKDVEVEQVDACEIWNCRKGHAGFEVNHISCASVESTDESLNEMEKSRLFWEACLAS